MAQDKPDRLLPARHYARECEAGHRRGSQLARRQCGWFKGRVSPACDAPCLVLEWTTMACATKRRALSLAGPGWTYNGSRALIFFRRHV